MSEHNTHVRPCTKEKVYLSRDERAVNAIINAERMHTERAKFKKMFIMLNLNWLWAQDNNQKYQKNNNDLKYEQGQVTSVELGVLKSLRDVEAES